MPWKLISLVGGVVVVVIIAAVAIAGSGHTSSNGACLGDLAQNLPASAGNRLVLGTDLAEARSKGFKDTTTLEDLGASEQATGTWPGQLTEDLRFGSLESDAAFTDHTGVKPGDLTCTLGVTGQEVSRGRFDAAKVQGSDLADRGHLAASDSTLAYAHSTPGQLLEPRAKGSLAGDPRFVAVLGGLREQHAYSIAINLGSSTSKTGLQALGIGIAPADGAHRQLVVAAYYANATGSRSAATSRARLAALLRGLEPSINVHVSDLTAKGQVVTGTFAIQEPASWYPPLRKAQDLVPSSG